MEQLKSTKKEEKLAIRERMLLKSMERAEVKFDEKQKKRLLELYEEVLKELKL